MIPDLLILSVHIFVRPLVMLKPQGMTTVHVLGNILTSALVQETQ